jgi:hypothetical protein
MACHVCQVHVTTHTREVDKSCVCIVCSLARDIFIAKRPSNVLSLSLFLWRIIFQLVKKKKRKRIGTKVEGGVS